MIIRFFDQGDGSGAAAVDYLLAAEVRAYDDARRPISGQTRHRALLPEVMGGDPERTRALIDACPRKWRYTSGVIAFAASDTPDEAEQAEVRAGFEAAAFAGLAPDQRDILWVRHRHQGNVELHFLIPRTELHRGRAFNPAPPGAERYFNAFRDYWNARKGWADPSDPARRRDLRPVVEQGERGAIRTAIHALMIEQIEAGEIRDHAGILAALAGLGDAGLEIKPPRETRRKSMRPKRPATRVTLRRIGSTDTRETYRLEDRIFHEDWTAEEYFSGKAARAAGECRKAAPPEHVEELRLKLEAAIARRAASNRGRYGGRVRKSADAVEVARLTAAFTARNGALHDPLVPVPILKLDDVPEVSPPETPEPRPELPWERAAPRQPVRRRKRPALLSRSPEPEEPLSDGRADPARKRAAALRRELAEHVERRRRRHGAIGTLAQDCERRSGTLRELADLFGRGTVARLGRGAAAIAELAQKVVARLTGRPGPQSTPRRRGFSPW